MEQNVFPAAVRDSVSLDTFKSDFKTYFLTVLTHNETDSDLLAPPIHC